MPVLLLLEDDPGIAIPLDACVRDAWLLQYGRATSTGDIDGFRARLAKCLAQSLADCLDVDLKPPTEAQLRYATSIARELGISLPSEALRYRGSMAEFIGRFVEAFRERRRSCLGHEIAP